MNFIRDICNSLIKLFMGVPSSHEVARLVIDQTKTLPGDFESDDASEEIPELPKEMIPEPFYSTMLSDLVETPLFVPGRMPMAGVPLEQPPSACKATDINIRRSDEDTAL